MNDWTFAEAMELVSRFFEAIGAFVLVAGLIFSVVLAIRSQRRTRDAVTTYRVLRQSFGAAILLGLEMLVAADLVRTVAIAPTIENVTVLGIIVLIRTILSLSLITEIEGVVPWRRAATSGAAYLAQAAKRSDESAQLM